MACRQSLRSLIRSFSDPILSSHRGNSSYHNVRNLTSVIGPVPSKCSSPTSGGLLMGWSMNHETPVVCGRGDKKTKKGKRFKGSYGNARPKKDKMISRLKEKIEVPSSTPWPLPFKLI
uniref:30S ribosomal protein S31, mitochondrial n=1 Tax=Picea sitchensis TaxID=3332 RepID=D5ABS2_PICSI|nr:unknown [Picea sitchensis]